MTISHKIIDGRKQATFVLDEVRTRVIRLKELGWQPRLVSIDIGDSQAVSLYITNQKRACDQVGIEFEHRHYPSSITPGRSLSTNAIGRSAAPVAITTLRVAMRSDTADVCPSTRVRPAGRVS